MTWLIDFEGYSLRNAPAVRTSLSVLHTLQNHYPERLGGAVCYHAPGLFSMTWKVRREGAVGVALQRQYGFLDMDQSGSVGSSRTHSMHLAVFRKLSHITDASVFETLPAAVCLKLYVHSRSAAGQTHLYPCCVDVSVLTMCVYMCLHQAVSPFIDPVTKKKIGFVDKGPKEVSHRACLGPWVLLRQCSKVQQTPAFLSFMTSTRTHRASAGVLAPA
jgi:hypothetical protein